MPGFETVRTRVRGKLRFLYIETIKVGNKIINQTVKIFKSIKNLTRKIRKRIVILILALIIALGVKNYHTPDSPSSYFTHQNRPEVCKLQEQKPMPMLQVAPTLGDSLDRETPSQRFIRESATNAYHIVEKQRELARIQNSPEFIIRSYSGRIFSMGGGQNDVTLFDYLIDILSGPDVIGKAHGFIPPISNHQPAWRNQEPKSELQKFLNGDQTQTNRHSMGSALEVKRGDADIEFLWSHQQIKKKGRHFKPNELNVTVAANQTNTQARVQYLEKFIKNPKNVVLQGDFNVDRARKLNNPSLAKKGFYIIDAQNCIISFFEASPYDYNQLRSSGNHTGKFTWTGSGSCPKANFVTMYQTTPGKLQRLFKTRSFQ